MVVVRAARFSLEPAEVSITFNVWATFGASAIRHHNTPGRRNARSREVHRLARHFTVYMIYPYLIPTYLES